jgi:DNA-binding NtrC family response regulator
LSLLDGCVDEEIILVVSDINMPDMSGLDLLPRAKERRPGLPVFVISAYGDRDTVTTALERGADGVSDQAADFAKQRRDSMTVHADAMRRDA